MSGPDPETPADSATAAPPAVSVVVPTRDRPHQLAGCLAALETQTAPSYEVVVVDDGSADTGAVAAVVAQAPHARLVRAAGSGPAAARNRGATAARAPVLCFTDDDCRPAPGWIDAIATGVHGDVAVAGPTRNGRPGDAYASASQAITNHLVEASFDPATRQIAFAPTSNLACSAALHRSLPFDESFPLAAGEDRDWCTRLLAAGGALLYEPSAPVAHHQDLSWRRFWRQQQRYGRGAHAYHRSAPRGGRLQAPGFYTGLLRAGFAEGVAPGMLVLVAQVATAVGIARAAVAARG
ncbi:MAG: glycosyltransferase [Acidimicrobiales bacterium]|nr:glycosyltransferase [Acidimicrobiales bacterium]